MSWLPDFKFDVGPPGLFFWLPLHPSLKDRPTTGDVFQHLLHVGVLVPKLIDSRKDSDGTIPQVSGMIYLKIIVQL